VKSGDVLRLAPGKTELKNYDMPSISFSNNQVLIWRPGYTAADVAEIQRLSQENDDLDIQQEEQSKEDNRDLLRLDELYKQLSADQKSAFEEYFVDYYDGASPSLKSTFKEDILNQQNLVDGADRALADCLSKQRKGEKTCSEEDVVDIQNRAKAAQEKIEKLQKLQADKVKSLKSIQTELFDLYDLKKEPAEKNKALHEAEFTEKHSAIIAQIQKLMDIQKPNRLTLRPPGGENETAFVKMDWDLKCSEDVPKDTCTSQFASVPLDGFPDEKPLIQDVSYVAKGGVLKFNLFDVNNEKIYEFAVNRVKENDRNGRIIFMGDVKIRSLKDGSIQSGVAKFVDRSH